MARIDLRSLLVIAFCLIGFQIICVSSAHAQTAVSASATVNWTAPTLAVDGSALTGAQAITSYQVWLATATIASNTATAPTATVSGSATTTTQTLQVAPGGSIFARVKACNASGCSDFSAEVSKVVTLAKPGVPTSVTIAITISP